MSEYVYALENLYKPTESKQSDSVRKPRSESIIADGIPQPAPSQTIENSRDGLEYSNCEFETIDLITLPSDPVEKTHDDSFTEYYPQFGAILPGMCVTNCFKF